MMNVLDCLRSSIHQDSDYKNIRNQLDLILLLWELCAKDYKEFLPFYSDLIK